MPAEQVFEEARGFWDAFIRSNGVAKALDDFAAVQYESSAQIDEENYRADTEKPAST
ncbi:hypothetical protein IVB33_39920 [Bradyrhizobium sp. 24]|uniref:hypothetical protein n=1 Tax=unclassified Bradyrhizobium TaxID=2631580 RepID=UPI001FFB79E4|nr:MULTISPECIES: hypothetical protein [unclassified Bradyrhizobium]MCK1303902.1 hypothetical protein [Bradyrhizobium sp. 37]MCK1382499.1 hypothetical protein [Bradyrhizobium sp. 24]MCK1770420.1 hypothetical protein [Bradyrhizobium sp. 134]